MNLFSRKNDFYTYRKDPHKSSTALRSITSIFSNPENVSVGLIKKHTNLLLLQTSFLVLLAISALVIELKADILESRVPKPRNVIAQSVEASISNETSVLGESAEIGSVFDELSDNPTELPGNQAEGTAQPGDKLNNQLTDQNAVQAAKPTPYPQPARDEYSIAVYGDSMVDTMGEVLEYLEAELKIRYPNTTFHLYNYGRGSETVKDGLERFHKPFVYQDRNFRPIAKVSPDIIIMGSFAYNVFTPHDRDAHWLGYTHLVQEAQSITKNVYMLVEIAPKRSGFGFGPNGVNWEPITAFEHTGKIIEQLENVIGLSSTLRVPLIDAFTPSLVEGKKEGKTELINPSDNIHPSVEGHQFIAKIIADTIELPE